MTYDDANDPGAGGRQQVVADGGSVDGAPGTVALPSGTSGIGFNDLRFSTTLEKVIVPAGRTGNLDLVDPATLTASAVPGFTMVAAYDGTDTVGTTSADEGNGLVYAMDQTSMKLSVVDPKVGQIVSSAPLTDAPVIVRFVKPNNEVWVTGTNGRIDVFSVSSASPPALTHSMFVSTAGGPVSLQINATLGIAYTNTAAGETLPIDLGTHTAGAPMKNGCDKSRGLALDEARGFLFVGCDEGKISVLDIAHGGAVLSTIVVGEGIDELAYDPTRLRLYAPGARSSTMAVVAVSIGGKLSQLGTIAIPPGAHCVTVDDHAMTYVCDAESGQLLAFADRY